MFFIIFVLSSLQKIIELNMKKSFFLLFFSILIVCYIFYHFYNKIQQKIDNIDINNVKNNIIILQNENKKIYDNYEKINTLYEKQKIEIEKLETSNLVLQEEINNIKKENPEYIKTKVLALNLLTKIMIAINNKSDFLDKIEELKVLANSNLNLIEDLESLKIFNTNKINIDIIMKDFYIESNNNYSFYEPIEFKNKNINSITKNIIKIKKIKNKDEIQNIENNIATIKQNIENLNYQEAINIIKTNNLETKFQKTVSNLENKIKFDLLLNKLIYAF